MKDVIVSTKGQAFILLVVTALLYATSLYSYLLFHTVSELASISIAFGAFMIGWNSRHFLNNRYLLVLAIAYLFIGILDLLHTLAYRGMNIFPHYDYATQLWIATRYMEALSLLVAFSVLKAKRELDPRAVLAAYTALTTVVILSVFVWQIFPVCLVEGVGLTPFKKISEYLICAILLLVLTQLRANKDLFHPPVRRLLFWSVCCTIVSELAFTFYISTHGISNLVGHFFKLYSFLLVYKALIDTGIREPYAVIFRELKESEEQLAMSESRFRGLVESSQDVIWETDAEGRYTYVSPQMHDLMGYTPEEALGLLRSGLFKALEPGHEMPAGAGGRQEMHGHHSDGHDVVVESSAVPFTDTHGVPLGMRGVDRDITDRKERERFKEDVERIMRHDLKTPLNAIINLPPILYDAPYLDEEGREVLELIEQAGYQMHNQINLTLDLFRMESGSFQYAPKPTNLTRTLARCVRDLGDKAKQHNVRIALRVRDTIEPPYPGTTVLAEETLCYTIVTNLLSNALEAAPENSEVTVLLGKRDGLHAVDIHNKGVVPKEVRETFFEKYATHGKQAGTGLGTYSARTMARAQKGDVVFTTDEETGTTVTFLLPDVPVA